MRLTVRAAPKEHLRWLEERTGLALGAHANGIEAVNRAGDIRGMVAYDNWAPNSVQVHMAADTPIAWRSLMGPVCFYPFVERGKGVVLGAIAADNERSLRAAQHMGFRPICRVKDGHDKGVDLLIIEMRKETCHWLGGAS